MDGFLLVDKPIGLTSHDVVAKIRRILRQEISNQKLVNSKNKLVPNSKLLVSTSPKVKVGHTGTLDPLASGLLILVVGSYTKRAQEFSKLDKTYEVELTLGATSTTGDSEGKITPLRVRPLEPVEPKKSQVTSLRVVPVEEPSLEEVEVVLRQFKGKIQQTPHIYSAVKVGGQRAYKLARQGKKVEIEPRQVTIYSIENIKYKYPKLRFTTGVSSGTYIRSLAEDISQKLGTGAYVSALRRTRVGRFGIKNAPGFENLSLESLEVYIKFDNHKQK